MVEAEDNLNFKDNKDIMGRIGEEQIYFSAKMRKIATEKKMSFSFFTNQDRNLLITDHAIYNLNGTEIKRRIKIEDIKAFTVSKTSNQFIIHGSQSEYDYLFVYPDRRKIAKILQNAFESKTGKDLLFCKKDDKDLTKFVVGKKERLKNPYLFKIDQNELTSIKDYIEEQADKEPEEKPTPPPKSAAKVETSSGEPKVVSGKGKGVPPPPPPPPPPPKVATIPTTQKAPSSSKPVDLAAELAAKKNNLSHVEVKEYVSPALQKPEEGGAPQTGNSMMAAIIAKRNQMKKIGGAGAGTSNTVKPPSKPSAPSGNIPKQGGTTNAPKSNISSTGGMPKPVTNTAPKPTTGGGMPKPASKPATTGGSKPPMKVGGGGGSAFAAKMAALQARMAGGAGGGSTSSSSTAPASSGPSKPIVELCEGNTKRMDINKVIGNLEKEKQKQASKKLSSPPKVKIVSAKGKGVPPPPPPPPPPPMK